MTEEATNVHALIIAWLLGAKLSVEGLAPALDQATRDDEICARAARQERQI